MTRIANQHQQQGLKRFLFCLVFWILVTQCDYDWVFESVQNYFEPNGVTEVGEENIGNNHLQHGDEAKVTGKTSLFYRKVQQNNETGQNSIRNQFA